MEAGLQQNPNRFVGSNYYILILRAPKIFFGYQAPKIGDVLKRKFRT